MHGKVGAKELNKKIYWRNNPNMNILKNHAYYKFYATSLYRSEICRDVLI